MSLRDLLQDNLQASQVVPYNPAAPKGSSENPIGFKPGVMNYFAHYNLLENRGYTMLYNDFNPFSPYWIVVAVQSQEAWNKLVPDTRAAG